MHVIGDELAIKASRMRNGEMTNEEPGIIPSHLMGHCSRAGMTSSTAAMPQRFINVDNKSIFMDFKNHGFPGSCRVAGTTAHSTAQLLAIGVDQARRIPSDVPPTPSRCL